MERKVKVFDTPLVRSGAKMFITNNIRAKDRRDGFDASMRMIVTEASMWANDTMTFGEVIERIGKLLSESPVAEIQGLNARLMARAICHPIREETN